MFTWLHKMHVEMHYIGDRFVVNKSDLADVSLDVVRNRANDILVARGRYMWSVDRLVVKDYSTTWGALIRISHDRASFMGT